MQLSEAIQLIQSDKLSRSTPSEWADLGCGSGLFSYALSHFLKSGSRLYAVDKVNPIKPEIQPNGVELIPVQQDFVTDPLNLQNLDGILMANALHYVKNKPVLIERLKASLKPDGLFLLVEYDTDRPVPTWVPYPIRFSALTPLFQSAGYGSVQKLAERPSRYGTGSMYAALISPDATPGII